MTSNQISAALARETERHNKEQEILNQRAQEEIERNNRINRILGAAQVINSSAQIISNAAGTSYGNLIKTESNTIEANKVANDRRFKEQSLGLSRIQQAETERHQKEQDRLALRNIQHLEYYDALVAQMNEFQRNQKIFENQQTLTENEFKLVDNEFRRVEQSLAKYRAELDRARVNNEALNSLMNQLSTQYEVQYTQAKTQAAKAKVVSDYMNASANLIKSISSVIMDLPSL